MQPKPADLSWKNDATPVSNAFGDVYFSPEDGVAETRHVFLQGTDLPEAWQNRPGFTIGETGFGTGLNFLSVWDLWRRTRPSGGRLHFVSAEAFPVSLSDLSRAHRAWPQFKTLSERLLVHYPPPAAGFHRLHFDEDNVHLTLLFGEAGEVLSALEASVDAWFLDGFAPASNPQMWRDEIFQEMARLSKPGARVATFTVAGAVRRGLTNAGFDVEKAPGFGRKREMLRARYTGEPKARAGQPWYRLPDATGPARVAIVGGGIAGAATAHALRRRGAEVTLIERTGRLAAGASGNAVGLVMPRLTVDPTPAGRFHTAAFLYTTRLLEQFGDTADWHACGALQLAPPGPELERFEHLADQPALPAGLMSLVDRNEASTLAGSRVAHGGLYFPTAGFLHPPDFVRALADSSDVVAGTAEAIGRPDGSPTGEILARTDAIVAANSAEAAEFAEIAHLPLRRSLGQLTYVPAASLPAELACVVTFGGYAAPPRNGMVTVGATYEPLEHSLPADQLIVSALRHDKNLGAARSALPGLFDALETKALTGRIAIRATTPDHLPIAGPVPRVEFFRQNYQALQHGKSARHFPDADYYDHLYMCTGLGSRGLVTAPLIGEILASILYGDPIPLERSVLEALHPARFLIRDLKRGRMTHA